MTLSRTLAVSDASQIVIVSGEPYRFIIKNQIDMMKDLTAVQKKVLKSALVLEPCPKNTLPAILLGMKFIEQNRSFDDDDLLYVFPSDHIIEPVSKFVSSLKKGAAAAQDDRLVVFGIVPDRPHEGYGYIVPATKAKGDAVSVERFTEKPDRAKAQALLKQGAMWNAGIFCFKKSAFLAELAAHQSVLADFYCESFEGMLADFPACVKDSIDYAIMQKTDRASVVAFEPAWSDLGSWDSLLEFFSDGTKNFSYGRSALIESKDCLTYSKDRVVAGVGLQDLIIVDSPDAILVIKKGESDKVKQLVEKLEKEKAPEVEHSPTVYRPWGYYTILEERKGYKVKEIGVYPGRAMSLQKHSHRSEHWNIVEGKAQITIGEDVIVRSKNESVYVPKGTKHKIANPYKETVRMIEVQIGDYLGEDDIVRFEQYDA
jgi:mannose-1-phosphate guanylyltransferase/mannose-6-phosphate isomerase